MKFKVRESNGCFMVYRLVSRFLFGEAEEFVDIFVSLASVKQYIRSHIKKEWIFDTDTFEQEESKVT